METAKKVEEWSRKLGYTGNIPLDELKKICGPATQHIWDQLVDKVKPREEIKRMRRELVAHWLRKKIAGRAIVPVKEIEVFEEKKMLEVEITKLKEDVAEKHEELSILEKELSSSAASLKKLKAEVRENKQKELLYRTKTQKLKKDISVGRELLDIAQPEEFKDNNVSETFEKCVEKIKNITNEMVCSEELPLVFPQNDEVLTKDIEKLLQSNDFDIVVDLLSNMVKELKFKLEKCEPPNLNRTSDNEQCELFNELYAIDIENKLLTLKHKKEIKKLEVETNQIEQEKHNEIDALNLAPEQKKATHKILQLQIKNVEATAAFNEIKKPITFPSKNENVKTELDRVRTEMAHKQMEIDSHQKQIKYILALYDQMQSSILNSQIESEAIHTRLKSIAEDIISLRPSVENMNRREIKSFEKFKLGYNRKVKLNNEVRFVRDLLEDVVSASKLQSSMANVSPEEIFAEASQMSVKMKAIKAASTATNTMKYATYSTKDLEEGEAEVIRSIAKLQKVFADVPSTSRCAETEKAMKFYSEMAIQEAISPDRLFNGKTFKSYQKSYDDSYSKM